MIVISNRIPVKPEHREAFEKVFSERANLVDRMPGFITFQLLRPTQPDDPYIVMTYWESMADFEAWTSSPEFKQGHGRSGTLPPDAFAGPSKLELHEVIQQTNKTG